jgi:hypothetical protein
MVVSTPAKAPGGELVSDRRHQRPADADRDAGGVVDLDPLVVSPLRLAVDAHYRCAEWRRLDGVADPGGVGDGTLVPELLEHRSRVNAGASRDVEDWLIVLEGELLALVEVDAAREVGRGCRSIHSSGMVSSRRQSRLSASWRL